MLTQEDLMAIKGVFMDQFEAIDRRFESMEQRLDKMEQRLDKLESEVSSLKVGQMQMHQEIKNISKKVDATYELALDNWGQIIESKKRLDILEA